MSRQPRLDYPGALHHVVGRGIERRNIFGSDRDKEAFLKRIFHLQKTSNIRCYAWSIMSNHYHLLMQTGTSSLATFMRKLMTGYAVYYNKKHHREGHVFQNRYKSILCDADEYLLPLIRYIHRNPVRAKIVDYAGLEAYRWTGHREMVRASGEGIVSREAVLEYFGKREKEAVREYRNYVGEEGEDGKDYDGGGLIRSLGGMAAALQIRGDEREQADERVLGSGAFVEEVMQRAEQRIERQERIWPLEELLGRISDYYRVEKREILESHRKRVRNARSVYVYLGTEFGNKTATEMGRQLQISQAAASIAREKGRKAVEAENLEEKLLGAVDL